MVLHPLMLPWSWPCSPERTLLLCVSVASFSGWCGFLITLSPWILRYLRWLLASSEKAKDTVRIRPSLGNYTKSFPPHFIHRKKPQAQPTFKGRGNKLHLSVGRVARGKYVEASICSTKTKHNFPNCIQLYWIYLSCFQNENIWWNG